MSTTPNQGIAREASHRRRWLIGVTILVLLGVIGSFIGAVTVAHLDSQKMRQSSLVTSTAIASRLELAIQHELDLTTAVAAFIASNQEATQARFRNEVKSIQAFKRYPELQGLAELVLIPASKLSAFVTKENSLLPAGQSFTVQPPGVRSHYCFTTLFESRSVQQSAFLGIDQCDSQLGTLIMRARDDGQPTYLPYGGSLLVVGQPIYTGNTVPTTVKARHDAFIGWVGMEIIPSVVLDSLVASYPKIKVVFHYQVRSISENFMAGATSAKAYWSTIDLHNGWQVKTFGEANVEGVFSGSGPLGVLFGGIAFILLLGLLIYVLGTGRARALMLVNERTDELSYQAFHDSLTGLSNRALILDRISQMLARARRENTPLALLFLDLDDFKDINDTLGHDAGDQLLFAVGARLAAALREVDTVGRLGGDEFVVLVEGATIESGVQLVVDRILDVLQTPFSIRASKTPLNVTASIGIAEGLRATPEGLLRDADIALYEAKATGKRRAVYFSSSMRQAVDDHRNLDVDLHRAREAEEFFLLYQPTVNLLTGAVTGVEALLRWRHPQRGVLQPDEFIPLLESSGLIIPVGKWVLEEASRQGACWHSQGHTLQVSVNLAAAQLGQDEIINDVRSALRASRFDPGMMVLELTETTLMHNVQHTLTRLEHLKKIGVRLAIDDFGTGYSSLAYLRQFPIDILKIDQSFVQTMSNSPDSAAIVHTLVQLGKVLGLEIIAEGIETEEQRLRLEAEKVDTGQGFLFARPLDVEGVDQLLHDTHHGLVPDEIPN